MTQTRSEILEQPEVIERVLAENRDLAHKCAAAVRDGDIRYVLIAARGTSDNAATYAKYLFGAANRIPVALAAPSLYTFYGSTPVLNNALVIGISQSGASTDIVQVLRDAKAQGAPTLAITNTPDSPLAETCDFVLPLLAGVEKGVAATKTYTAELAAIALLSAVLAEDSESLDELSGVADAVEKALRIEEEIKQIVERYRYMDSSVVLSRGFNYGNAFETALKIKELAYVHTQAYSTADFMHGPLASIDEGFPVLAIAPTGAVYENLVQSLATVKEREGELLVISDGNEALSLAKVGVRVPQVPEWLSPIVDIIPGQWFAHYLALSKGYDPDHPRALHKVTLTR